jgi:hypothetical protein
VGKRGKSREADRVAAEKKAEAKAAEYTPPLEWALKGLARLRVRRLPIGLALSLAVGALVFLNGEYSNCTGRGSLDLLKPAQPPSPPSSPLAVSPAFKVIEDHGQAEETFPVQVRNNSDHEVSGEVLQFEARPSLEQTEFWLDPEAVPEVIVGSSPHGTNVVELDPRIHDWVSSEQGSLLLVPLGTVAPGDVVKFTAHVRSVKRCDTLQLSGSTVPRSQVAQCLTNYHFVTSRSDEVVMGDWYILVSDEDGGGATRRR